MTSLIEPEVESRIASALLELNGRLEETVNAATNRAFNLGCAVGLIPAAVIIITTYFLTNNSLLGSVIMFVFMVLGLVLFANMVASITRRNTLKRNYHEDIEPQLIKLAAENNLELTHIYAVGALTLPEGSGLSELFPDILIPENKFQNGDHAEINIDL